VLMRLPQRAQQEGRAAQTSDRRRRAGRCGLSMQASSGWVAAAGGNNGARHSDTIAEQARSTAALHQTQPDLSCMLNTQTAKARRREGSGGQMVSSCGKVQRAEALLLKAAAHLQGNKHARSTQHMHAMLTHGLSTPVLQVLGVLGALVGRGGGHGVLAWKRQTEEQCRFGRCACTLRPHPRQTAAGTRLQRLQTLAAPTTKSTAALALHGTHRPRPRQTAPGTQ